MSHDLWQQLLILCTYWQELNLVIAVTQNDLEHIPMLQVSWHLQRHGERPAGLTGGDHGSLLAGKSTLIKTQSPLAHQTFGEDTCLPLVYC